MIVESRIPIRSSCLVCIRYMSWSKFQVPCTRASRHVMQRTNNYKEFIVSPWGVSAKSASAFKFITSITSWQSSLPKSLIPSKFQPHFDHPGQWFFSGTIGIPPVVFYAFLLQRTVTLSLNTNTMPHFLSCALILCIYYYNYQPLLIRKWGGNFVNSRISHL